MRITAWESIPYRIKSNAGLEDPSIVDAYREIYFFVDKEELDTFGDVKSGRAILVNHTVTKTNVLDRCDYKSVNNNLVIFNMYTFDVTFENGIRDYASAQFILQNAFSSSTVNIWDALEPGYYRTGNSYYTSQIVNNDELGNYFEDSESMNVLIPEPQYYTINHMDIMTNDFHALNSIRTLYIYSGMQLVDKRTKLHVYDKALWTTMYNKNLEEMNRYRNKEDYSKMDITEVSDSLFYDTANSMITGLMYSYDSLKKLVQIAYSPGLLVNVPFHNYQNRNKVRNEILSIKNGLLNLCGNIEKNFGNFTLYYYPSKMGDKVQMNFLDYLPENQPIYKNLVSVDKNTPLNNHLHATAIEIEAIETIDY